MTRSNQSEHNAPSPSILYEDEDEKIYPTNFFREISTKVDIRLPVLTFSTKQTILSVFLIDRVN